VKAASAKLPWFAAIVLENQRMAEKVGTGISINPMVIALHPMA